MEVIFLTAGRLPFFDVTIEFSHAPGGPDFSYVEKQQAKFLSDHMPYMATTLGHINRAWHDRRASRADIDFYDVEDPLINKVRQMIAKGHRGLSAGMRFISQPRLIARGRYMIDNWTLGEISATPLPRDANTNITKMSAAGETIDEEFGMPCFIAGQQPRSLSEALEMQADTGAPGTLWLPLHWQRISAVQLQVAKELHGTNR